MCRGVADGRRPVGGGGHVLLPCPAGALQAAVEAAPAQSTQHPDGEQSG